MKYSTTDFLKVATNTAEHFGFRTADKLKKDPACRNCEVGLSHSIGLEDTKLDLHGGIWPNSVATFCDQNLHALNAPVLLYSLEPIEGTGDTALTLNIFNVQKSIAEAILIQACRSLLTELGHEDHLVRINSLGDSESSVRYARELTTFLRKRLEVMPSSSRELMKQHPLLALMDLVAQEHELAHKSPNPLEFLSDQSRKHFREIVEYLDMSEAPYEIDPKMIGHHEYYSDALFSIENLTPTEDEANSIMARGGRFDEFFYRKTKSKTPAVGAVVTLKNNKPVARMPKSKYSPSSVYVVQLGFGPKMRSLMIIDELRRAGIAVEHDLASDSLSAQLREAEARGARYTVIIGQKEFVEQSVILRDMKERNQEQISIDNMVKKLKRQQTSSLRV
ncbi:MAG: His/Gly/Thr/Pro-type tRNA ligase C-terminal domain-containing protein [Candidatus Paceibacterota bacterium]